MDEAAQPPLPNERKLALHGTRNFRDIGGYLTADGKHQTRWHLLYRSDLLDKLSQDAEATAFLRDKLKVASAIDLRSVEERQLHPYTIPGVATYRVPLSGGESLLRNLQEANEITEELVENLMCAMYEHFVTAAVPELTQFFNIIVERAEHQRFDDALVYHCRAGKDRTGICTALLLLTLGVPEKTVYEDFLMTNQFYSPPPLGTVKAVLKTDDIQPGAATALFEARKCYLERALRVIAEQHSSVHNFMIERLGMTPAILEMLSHALLEPADTPKTG